VEKCLNPESNFGDYWEYEERVDKEVRQAVNEFMLPHNMTRIISARVKDVILMQGRILNGKNINRIRRHPEFFYASLLYKTMAPHLGWPECEFLPEPRLGTSKIGHRPNNKKRRVNKRSNNKPRDNK
jgi:hypothetical protein